MARFLHTRGHQTDLDDDSPPDGTQRSTPPSRQNPRLLTLSEEELNQRIEREAQSRHDRETARQNRTPRGREKAITRRGPVAVRPDREGTRGPRAHPSATDGAVDGPPRQYGETVDAHTIDPIINALPEKERKRILELPNAGQGLPGRKVIVDEALKTYGRLEYERGVRETQAKLKKDPTFRKSVLADLRGSYQDPELYPGSGAPSDSGLDSDNVSNILRRQYHSALDPTSSA